jgi:hypothetical protein
MMEVLYKEELNFGSSPNIIRLVISRRIGREINTTHTHGKMRK